MPGLCPSSTMWLPENFSLSFLQFKMGTKALTSQLFRDEMNQHTCRALGDFHAVKAPGQNHSRPHPDPHPLSQPTRLPWQKPFTSECLKPSPQLHPTAMNLVAPLKCEVRPCTGLPASRAVLSKPSCPMTVTHLKHQLWLCKVLCLNL